MTLTDQPIDVTLTQWLRLLWNVAPPLRLDSESPYIAAGTIHLPARSHWRRHEAAAAHAAAHLIYSPPRFVGTGLGPIVRALAGLLEDARVEALAIRELPGLARIWRPLHTATPALGSHFDALMQRLARALADPDYDDPNAWVRKGRKLFFLDARLGLLALRTPAEVVNAATLLGHDIGQIRLQFNPKTYRPEPAYRDDHRWMWPADAQEEASPPPLPPPGAPAGVSHKDERPEEVDTSTVLYPEWDRLIARMRPDWCRVIEAKPPQREPPVAIETHAALAVVRKTGAGLGHRLRQILRPESARIRSDEGETIDVAALMDWRLSRRMRMPGDDRIHLVSGRRFAQGSMLLLIDRSASTGAIVGAGNRSVLELVARSAAVLACALLAAGTRSSIAAFSSNGRHEVRVRTLKGFNEPMDAAVLARLGALRPGGSTRLGAALRHATDRLGRCRGRRWLLVLSDGEANDVDVHDPHYLREDSIRAEREAARRAVSVASCFIEGAGARDARTWVIRSRAKAGQYGWLAAVARDSFSDRWLF